MFAIGLFLPLWASLDGANTKYVGSPDAGVFTLAGSGAKSWDALREGGDAPAPTSVVITRSLLVIMGPLALIAVIVSAVGAFRRRAPASHWARYVVDSTIGLSVAFVGALVAWEGTPHVSGVVAIPALVIARAWLAKVPLRAQLYAMPPYAGLATPPPA
ncbi:MAG: hypothetical protein ACKV2T_09775 [Kofleriaceae bacterium]